MKSSILVSLLLASLNSFSQTEKSISTSEIKNVKVFVSGAQVDRSFRTTVDAGVTRLAVENLSSQIDQRSINATINGNAMVLSTSFELDYLKEKKVSPELKKLKDSLETLNADLNELNMYKSVYNEETAMLNANKSIGGSNVGVNAENLKKAIDFYRSRMIEVKVKVMDIDKKIEKLNDKIKRINEQIVQENGKINRPYGTILIDISARQKENIEIELSYYSQGASWGPSYDMRAKNTTSNVSLMYKANVSQNTGENWEKVNVTLSTGNPTLGGNKPQLQPWFLRYYQPVIYETQSLKSRGARKETADMDMAPASNEAGVSKFVEVVKMQENQMSTDFEIQMPYTILSDGKNVLMDIQSYDLPADFSYFCTPKLDRDAFLAARITGWEKLNLLPGPSKIYLENSYVGESYINPSSAIDTLLLSFGRDKRISIKRETVKEFNSTKFIGSNVEKEFLYEITLKNTKKEKITLTIDDQIPLSTDESIKIYPGELSKGNYNTETGMVNWKLDLNAGETKKIRLGYKVKYPKDKVIQGL